MPDTNLLSADQQEPQQPVVQSIDQKTIPAGTIGPRHLQGDYTMIQFGLAADLPTNTSSNLNRVYFSKDINRLSAWNGTAWAQFQAQVFVSASSTGQSGDYTNIQTAIDYVNSIGGGTVFIRNGTYIQTSNITIPSNVALVGETQGGVIIDFNSYGNQILVQGTNVYSTGTISVNNNSANVTGSSTSWTVAMVGDYMLINGANYLIDTVTDTTHIVLDSNFGGDNLSGATYLINKPVFSAALSNMTIQNSTNSTGSLFRQYTSGTTLLNMTFLNSTLGYELKDSDVANDTNMTAINCTSGCVYNNTSGTSITTLAVSTTTSGDGIALTSVNAFSLLNWSVFNAAGRGIVITTSFDWGVLDFALVSNTGIAMELVTAKDGDIISGTFLNNTTDAIKLTSNNLRNMISNNIIRNNGGWGINVANANDTDNLIGINILRSNTSGSITNSGTTTLIRSNIGATDN